MANSDIHRVHSYFIWNNTSERGVREEVHVTKDFLIKADSEELALEYAKTKLRKAISETRIYAYKDSLEIIDLKDESKKETA